MEGVNQTKAPISHPFLFIQHFNLKDKSGSNSKISEVLPEASTTVLIKCSHTFPFGVVVKNI